MLEELSHTEKTSAVLEELCAGPGVLNFGSGCMAAVPSGQEPARRLEAHQAQLLLAAGNPETAV